MTQPRDTERLLKEQIEVLESQYAMAKAAARANWFRFIKAQKALYGVMRWLDVSIEHETLAMLQDSGWYNEACDVIGWNFDYTTQERYRL